MNQQALTNDHRAQVCQFVIEGGIGEQFDALEYLIRTRAAQGIADQPTYELFFHPYTSTPSR